MDAHAVITLIWLAAALLAGRFAYRRRSACHAALAAGGLLLASLHGWGWNKPIYFAGRRALQAIGLYDERIVFKVLIGCVFFGLLAWLVVTLHGRLRALPRAHRIAFAAMALDALYITVRTLSVDGWMPDVIGVEPGKSVLGLALAATAVAAMPFTQAPTPQEEPRVAGRG